MDGQHRASSWPRQAWAALLLLALSVAPAVLSPWGLAQLSFVAIYSLAGSGLMLLAGSAGLLVLCHAAFLGVGAYAEALLREQGWPLPLSLLGAMLTAAAVGSLAAWPARKLSGVSLAIATLAFGFIVQEVLMRWEALTGGNAGLSLAPFDPTALYGLSVAAALGALWLHGRLGRGRWGRALRALREDAVAAAALGVAIPRLKVQAFTLAAALGGLAGALYAHQLRFVSPEQFDWVMSIELLMMLVVGGLGTRAGIVLGAVFLIAVPQMIAILRDWLDWDAPPAGLETLIFGLLLILTLRWAPQGLAGGWRRDGRGPSL